MMTSPGSRTEQALADTTNTTTDTADPANTSAAQGGARMLVPLLLFDVGLPIVAYYLLHALGVSDVLALTAGGLIAGLRAVYTIVRDRKVDGFAVFVLAMFAVGLALAFLTGDARFVLAKESVGIGVAGLVFLASCVVGKPFVYYSGKRFATGGDPARAAEWEHKYATLPRFRALLVRMSLLWGLGMLGTSLVTVVLVYQLPVSVMVTVSNLMHIACFVVLIAITARMGRKAKRAAAAGCGARRGPSMNEG